MMFVPMVWNDEDDMMDLFDPEKTWRRMWNSFNSDSNWMDGMKTDIVENGNNYELKADLPGFAKEDINVDLKDHVLAKLTKQEQDTLRKSMETACDAVERILDDELHVGIDRGDDVVPGGRIAHGDSGRAFPSTRRASRHRGRRRAEKNRFRRIHGLTPVLMSFQKNSPRACSAVNCSSSLSNPGSWQRASSARAICWASAGS